MSQRNRLYRELEFLQRRLNAARDGSAERAKIAAEIECIEDELEELDECSSEAGSVARGARGGA